MTFRSRNFLLRLFRCLESCLYIVAKVCVALVLGCYFLVIHRAIMTLVVQFATMARLRNLVILHRLVHLVPCLTESVA